MKKYKECATCAQWRQCSSTGAARSEDLGKCVIKAPWNWFPANFGCELHERVADADQAWMQQISERNQLVGAVS